VTDDPEKIRKAKERAARREKRKLEKLQRELSEKGELTDWEAEFSESVSERLDKYGAAFRDREKGRATDVLSYEQKKIVSALRKKAKGKTKSGFRSKSGFKSKKQFTPRVRNIEDDFPKEPAEPYIPEYKPDNPSKPKRPFLRLVKNEEEE
jgi:hypothetical protein